VTIHQITIVGTGLIGGSLGLAIRATAPEIRVVGCDSGEILQKAIVNQAIDYAESDLDKAIRGSQVVVVALPIAGIIDCIERLGPVLPQDVLLTDVGSTKVEIARRAEAVFGKADVARRFLPGHPLAGREHSGIDYAETLLFRNAPWLFVAPSEISLPPLQKEFTALIRTIGATLVFLTAERHDQLVAWTSHLPQMISTAVAATLVDEFGADAPLLDIGGRALKELTRISGSPYSMWRDVAITNKENLANALSKIEQRLAHIRENLDTKQLAEEFERAHQLRKSPPRRHEKLKK